MNRNTCKIGYTIIATTAYQQKIVEDLASAAYYEDRFSYALPDLGSYCEKLHGKWITISNINNTSTDSEKGTVATSIVWQFETYEGSIQKKLIKKYIYEQMEKKLSEEGFYKLNE